MFNGIYGYIFGSQENEVQGSNGDVQTIAVETTKDDGGWFLVPESGRSSPVMVSEGVLEELLSLSSATSTPAAPSPSELRRAQLLKEARAAARQRSQLQSALFAEQQPPAKAAPAAVAAATSNKAALKRAAISTLVQSEAKTQPRSKKAGKMSSGRNNDRKVNKLI